MHTAEESGWSRESAREVNSVLLFPSQDFEHEHFSIRRKSKEIVLMSNTDQTDRIRYLYKFHFEDRIVKEFEVVLDATTLQLLSSRSPVGPDWTRLSYSQCENCPLGPTVEFCPIALNLSHIVETFRDSLSFQKALVTVETLERSYTRETTLQKGLSSLIGLIMVTSGCPVLDKLRPMARFHLPFASSLETFYRALGMYLVAQFFLMRSGKKPDWELKGLASIYESVGVVNKGMSHRLAAASTQDANVNALIILHAFGEAVQYFINSGLDQIEKLFSVYIASSTEN